MPRRAVLAPTVSVPTVPGPTALAALALAAAIALPQAAQAERVTSRDDFLSLVEQRQLTRMGISLQVMPDGRIGGRAFGREVRGSWEWRSGWFCRTLGWGDRQWPLDCQLVERSGDRLTFTSGKGAGDKATLRLR
ncbi:dihydrodipicolinate reductase [Paracoccus salsus]|uniref:dihydrodipicolinate reductase n=1 Tax=Paracoccus salsus TaxID=2911061 RepID=UPI001F41811E|nr:dihydrodipicolinate reductase [Paracoccus salsus]MCF3973810.1 dihydrodipicolinate reductase [Paracoccus salsus]